LPTTSEKQLLSKLETAGPYLSVRLIPTGSRVAEMSLLEARNLILQNRVSLRGWDFPHADQNIIQSAGNYLYSVIDWERHVELWRIYRDGQFVYIANLWDVSFDLQDQLRAEFERDVILVNSHQKTSVVGVTSFVSMIYAVTEVYAFASRYAIARDIDGIDIKIVLNKAEGWALASGQPQIPWHSFYRCGTDRVETGGSVPSAIIKGDFRASASSAVRDIFAAFNWLDPNDQMIQGWQDRLISGRFAF